MLIGGILLGLVAGLRAGGSIFNLASVRLRWVAILFLAVIVRFGTEWAIEDGIELGRDAAAGPSSHSPSGCSSPASGSTASNRA